MGTWSLFSSSSLLTPSTPFLGTFSMWSTPNMGNLSLNPPSSSAQNVTISFQFTPGSMGMFHPGSGVSPPFPSGNTNPNLNPGNFVGFLFGWNWDSTTPHAQHNVGLTYTGSSSQTLGNNPSLRNVGGNPPLGIQSSRTQSVPTPQHNVGFNPYSTQK